MQFTLPGVPCVYYGDEAGMEGYRDPFNRGCYPWGREDAGLLEWYRSLGRLRAACACLREGEFVPVRAKGDTLAYLRRDEVNRFSVRFNRGTASQKLHLGEEWRQAEVLAGSAPDAEGTVVCLPSAVMPSYFTKMQNTKSNKKRSPEKGTSFAYRIR